MTNDEREIRAARNQSMFRAVNERIREISETIAAMQDALTIACECADTTCIEAIQIQPAEYLAIRSNPRQFAVLAGHVYPDVERVVRETADYVVVEKIGDGADVAELLAENA